MIAENKRSCLKIGNIELLTNVSLAPMAGITDRVFRQIIRDFSKTCLLTTEMLSSEALKWNQREQPITDASPIEKPIAFQIAGHKPDLMGEAAKKLEEKSTIIDINMGCPVGKIVKNGDGSALMQNPKLAYEIIKSVKNSITIPVSVKFRLGWDFDSLNYLEFAKIVEEAGADLITVHGRTRSQLYAGNADWKAIGEIKKLVKIPVFANGDITDIEKAVECLNLTNCDGLAIGRGILGHPDLISRIEHYFNTKEIIEEPPIEKRIETLKIHLEKEIEFRGEQQGICYTRKFFAWYIKGIKGASAYRDKLVRLTNHREIIDVLNEIIDIAYEK